MKKILVLLTVVIIAIFAVVSAQASDPAVCQDCPPGTDHISVWTPDGGLQGEPFVEVTPIEKCHGCIVGARIEVLQKSLTHVIVIGEKATVSYTYDEWLKAGDTTRANAARQDCVVMIIFCFEGESPA